MESALRLEKPHLVSRTRAENTAAIAWQIAWFGLWLLPNLVLHVAARDLYTAKGIFNIDLLLDGAIALFLPSAWSPVLLSLVMLVDVLEGVLRTWFFSPEDLLQAARSLPSLPPERLCHYAGLALLVFGGLGCAAWLVRRRTVPRFRLRTAVAMVLMAFLCVSVDMFGGGRGSSGQRDAQSFYFFARVPERSLYRQVCAMLPRSHDSGAASPIDSASAHLLENLPSLAAGQRPNIVQVLVESWGTDTTGIIDRKIIAEYLTPEIRLRYRIVIGTVPFGGSTVYGETRELCNSTLGPDVRRPSSYPSLRQCLPYKLKEMGYRTEAVHGYFAGMYGRYLWYPSIGFDSSWFRNRLVSEGLSDCPGAFPGVCDSQIAQWLGNRLARSPSPLFVHWMTLNSHLPVPSGLSGLNAASCDFDPLVREREPLCAWFKLEYQVHSSIAALASRTDIPATAFVIVGDHAPPFTNIDLRNRFSDDRVPFVLLIPKQPAAPSHPLLLIARSQAQPGNGHGVRTSASKVLRRNLQRNVKPPDRALGETVGGQS